jgi:hypothetical protein
MGAIVRLSLVDENPPGDLLSFGGVSFRGTAWVY